MDEERTCTKCGFKGGINDFDMDAMDEDDPYPVCWICPNCNTHKYVEEPDGE